MIFGDDPCINKRLKIFETFWHIIFLNH